MHLRILFETGVNKNSDGAIIRYFDQVGYDSQLLRNALENFNADSAIGVIVTFGGMLAWSAANAAAPTAAAVTKPFISLVGSSDLPVTVNANCFGGVSLETYAYNQPRFGAVTFTANGASVTDTTNFLATGDRVAFSTARPQALLCQPAFPPICPTKPQSQPATQIHYVAGHRQHRRNPRQWGDCLGKAKPCCVHVQ